jgi:hypothetical protein
MNKLIVIALLMSFAAAADEDEAKHEGKHEKGKQEMPGPAPQLKDNEHFFVGHWSCTGKSMGGPMGPAGPRSSKLAASMDLGGHWMQLKVTPQEGPMKGKEMVDSFSGWDGTQHVRFDFGPGGMHKLTSKGFEGDKIVFEGEGWMGGDKMNVRHTITKKSPTEFDSLFEVGSAGAAMAPALEEHCKKG